MAYQNKGTFELQNMKGSMFNNTRKNDPKQPDLTGKLKLNGKEYYISGWNQKGRNGTPYISLQLADPETVGKKYQKNKPQPKPTASAPVQQQPQQVQAQPQPIAPQQPVNNGFVTQQNQTAQPQDQYVRANNVHQQNNDGMPV